MSIARMTRFNPDRDRIERSLRLTPEQRMLSSLEAFDLACLMARAGIKAERPEADEEEIRSLLRRRLELARRLEGAR